MSKSLSKQTKAAIARFKSLSEERRYEAQTTATIMKTIEMGLNTTIGEYSEVVRALRCAVEALKNYSNRPNPFAANKALFEIAKILKGDFE